MHSYYIPDSCFVAEHIALGTHINGIDAYRHDMTEIPAQTVAGAKVVVD